MLSTTKKGLITFVISPFFVVLIGNVTDQLLLYSNNPQLKRFLLYHDI